MRLVNGWLLQHAARISALVVIIALYVAAQLPEISRDERNKLAENYHFKQVPLPELPGYTYRTIRQVNPHLDRISAWISSVGASIALNDLDGDGIANDVCWVDPRIDKVIVMPVPGTSMRYNSIILDPAPLPYNEATMAPMGCLPGDVNEDGQIDIIVYYWGRTPIAFLRNQNGYISSEVYPTVESWFTNAATLADIDGDGHVDIIIANYFSDEAQILDTSSDNPQVMQHSMSRAFNAGTNHFLLWAGAETGEIPSVTFVDAGEVLSDELAHGWTLAVGAADLNSDLLPEIYFANDFGPDRLFHNRSQPGKVVLDLLEGERLLTTPASCVLGKDSFKGMGIDFGDINGDGLLDIYVSNIASEYALLESHFCFLSTGETDKMSEGVAPYINASEELGLSRSNWGWDSRLADFNNDGILEALQATGFVAGRTNRWPELQELAMGNDELLSNPHKWPRFQPGDDISGHTPNPFFARAGDGRFYDISSEIGIDVPMVTRGIATADVDGDGDLDFAVANQWETSYIYRNDCPHCGKYLVLRLLLPIAGEENMKTAVFPSEKGNGIKGRPAIGASATINHPDGRILTALIDGGNGHSGKRSSEIHLGLGNINQDSSLSVKLTWRGGDGQMHGETVYLPPGRYTILLGQSSEEGIS